MTEGTVVFPIGAGFSHFFNDNIGMDFNVGVNLSLTDDFNPVYDDINDGMWVAKLSLLIKVAELKTDTDGGRPLG